ncbi:MAG: homocysteine S-methyltransferase [Acidobacteria bacterium]|nr:homocysteine S-methyltransferase [Acidobacteriota bacterium]
MRDDASALAEFLAARGVLVLDGGLATALEERGHDLDDALWSARLLRDDPAEIRRAHLAYLEAGADCIISSSYQANIPALIAAGSSRRQAEALIRLSTTLAEEARDDFFARRSSAGRERPLVAASVGPYGAYLADGSEYVGGYGIGREELRAFHQPRWEILAEGATLFACETLPSRVEASVLLDLLRQTPDVRAWLSFSCRDGQHISDGTPIAECAERCAENDQVLAVGINCTPPGLISSLIAEARRGAPELPIVVYPNSGEDYDPGRRGWVGAPHPDPAREALDWYRQGARLIGGCCRTGTAHVRALREALAGTEYLEDA